MNILMPVDGSDYTARMLSYLAEHAELLPGNHRLAILTVIDPTSLDQYRLAQFSSLETLLDEIAQPILAPVRAFAEARGWHAEIDYVPGVAVEAILAKAATDKPDLIVMGTRGRSPLRSLLLGSVANGVLAGCRIPVLLIR